MPRTSDPTAKIKLLAAAETEFVRHGLAGAKVQEITQRAGLPKGAFYLHFASKDDAFRQLVDEFAHRAAGKTRLLLEAGARAGIYRSDLDLEVTCAFIAGAYDRMAARSCANCKSPTCRRSCGMCESCSCAESPAQR